MNFIHEKLRESEAYHSLRNMGRCGLISDIFLTPEEVRRHPPILLDMVLDCVIFFEKGVFLSETLNIVKEKLENRG